jgi:hypothetical protein
MRTKFNGWIEHTEMEQVWWEGDYETMNIEHEHYNIVNGKKFGLVIFYEQDYKIEFIIDNNIIIENDITINF